MVASLGTAAAMSLFLEACAKVGLTTPTLPPTATVEAVSPSATAGLPASTATSPSTTGPTAEPSSTPVEADDGEMTTVAFVKTSDRVEGVGRAMDLLGINPVEGKTVFLKPNFNSDDPPPASTHPEALRTLILRLQEMGARAITVGDRSGMGNAKRIMETLGVYAMADELGFDILPLDSLNGDSDWTLIRPPGSHWRGGFPFPRACLAFDAIVQTCCLKTHQYGGHFTMSLKNSVGFVAKTIPNNGNDFMNELHGSGHQRRMIAEINYAYSPALIVLDGVDAFRHGGPAEGTLCSPQVVLAGTDRIAIDAVGVALLRYFGTTAAVGQGPIFQQEQIARAVELGLGVDSPHKIKLVTDDADSAAYAEEIRGVFGGG